MSPGIETFELQCINVSSKSNTIVFRLLDLGKLITLSGSNCITNLLA